MLLREMWIAHMVMLLSPLHVGAYAGSISGKIDSKLQDPCTISTDSNAPQCSSMLADRYLQRCMVHFVGDRPMKSTTSSVGMGPSAAKEVKWLPQQCTTGRCEGWEISSRSRFLVKKNGEKPTESIASFCSTTYLTRLGIDRENQAKEEICVKNNKLSRRSADKSIPFEKIIIKPATMESLAHNTRLSVRAINPKNAEPIYGSKNILWAGLNESEYVYSLTLQDALCTWKRYCDPEARTVKSNVSLLGEVVPHDAKSFPSEHPISRLCRMEPNWFSANHALSCSLQQKGGLDALCSTENPLDTKPVMGIP